MGLDSEKITEANATAWRERALRAEAALGAAAMTLEKCSDEELRYELARRLTPTPIAYPSYEALERYIKELVSNRSNRHPDAKVVFERRVFDLAVMAVYGDKFLDWYRKW